MFAKRILLLSFTSVFMLPCFAAAQKEALPLDDLQRFTTVVEHIRNYYVTETDDKTLFENAIRGMLSGLDPHSAYLDAEEFSDLKVSTTGKFGGVGMEVTMEDGFVKVISPIDDTPASRAGVQAGDLIIKLDDTPVKGMTLRKAVDMMRGERGTSLILTIIRKGVSKPLKINIVRDIIRVKSVKKDLLDKNFGYIRLSQFQTRSSEDLLQAIAALKKESSNQLKGLILDLRNNPGGILDAAVEISDAFLDRKSLKDNGLIVYTKGRLPGSKIKESAHNGDILSGAPMVVIINGGSASASEIVAGALQDHKRAIILGTPSFGKGSVQTVLPLKDNRGLKLTTALYYTPSGRSIQAKGIVPDIEVSALQIAEGEKDTIATATALKEKDLAGHLANGNGSPEGIEANIEKAKALAVKDYQLNEALNLLKGLVFSRAHKS